MIGRGKAAPVGVGRRASVSRDFLRDCRSFLSGSVVVSCFISCIVLHTRRHTRQGQVYVCSDHSTRLAPCDHPVGAGGLFVIGCCPRCLSLDCTSCVRELKAPSVSRLSNWLGSEYLDGGHLTLVTLVTKLSPRARFPWTLFRLMYGENNFHK